MLLSSLVWVCSAACVPCQGLKPVNSPACILPLLTPCFGFCKTVPESEVWKYKILRYHKHSPRSVQVQSFACLPNYKEGNQNTIIWSKISFQHHYPLHWKPHPQVTDFPKWKVYAVFILSIKEPWKATELKLLLLWTTVILWNHTVFSPILI